MMGGKENFPIGKGVKQVLLETEVRGSKKGGYPLREGIEKLTSKKALN